MARGSPKKVDIRTVARHAGVSTATVSRVMNGVGKVNAEMALRVQKAIDELDFSPSSHARTLVSGRSRMIGLIVTLITNPFYPELIQSFESHAAASGYDILIGSTDYRAEQKLSCVKRMQDRHVDGIAVMTFGSDTELLRELSKLGLPVVGVGDAGVRGVQGISVHFREGVHQAVQHLAVLGHRRMGFISGPLRVDNSLARQQAFLEGMKTIGARVPKQLLYEGDHSMESGLAGAERMLSLPEPPTAILCSNDLTAIGVLHAAAARNMRVPRDLSVVGFDDIHMSQFTVPPLTTVRMSGEDIAKVALDVLIPAIEGREARALDAVLTRLIVRQSTTYAPGPGPSPRKKRI